MIIKVINITEKINDIEVHVRVHDEKAIRDHGVIMSMREGGINS